MFFREKPKEKGMVGKENALRRKDVRMERMQERKNAKIALKRTQLTYKLSKTRRQASTTSSTRSLGFVGRRRETATQGPVLKWFVDSTEEDGKDKFGKWDPCSFPNIQKMVQIIYPPV